MDGIITILVASRRDEDQKRILEALPEQMDFFIIGIVKDETGAIIKSEYLKPHVLILDLQLSELNGTELVRIIRRRSPSTSIIILQDCIVNQSPVDFASLMSGISGFLLKESDIDKLAHIIKIVFLGGCYINASITVKIINSVTCINQITELPENRVFSSAERSIVVLIAQGMTDSQIADELNFSVGTIRNYMTEIRHKTKMKSRIEIVIYSLVSGLICMEHLIMWNKNYNDAILNFGISFTNKE